MKYAVMQPYFIPYVGYWQMMAEVDVFVVYDDVQFVKQSWITRNRLMVANEPSWLTLPLKKAPLRTKINDISLSPELVPNFWKKTRKTILINYSRASELEELKRWISVLESLSVKFSNLADFLFNHLNWVNQELDLGARLMRSSEIALPTNLSRVERLIAIGDVLGSKSYVNSIGGVDLYSKKEFAQHGFELNFFQPILRPYPQSRAGFVPGLSILDCVAHIPRSELRNYIFDGVC